VVAHGGDLERFGIARLTAMLYRRMDDGGDDVVVSECCVAQDAEHFIELAVRIANNTGETWLVAIASVVPPFSVLHCSCFTRCGQLIPPTARLNISRQAARETLRWP